MFIENSTSENKQNVKKSIIANIFNKKYVAVYIIALMTAMVGLAGEISPFSLSIMAACFANAIPTIGIIIMSLIGSSIKFGVEGAAGYLLTTLAMVITFFIVKPKYNEEDKNEQIKLKRLKGGIKK